MTELTELTEPNAQLYTMEVAGTSPVSLAEMKAYLGGSKDSDDALVQILIDACTQWGQKYTGRDFTDNQYTLLLDCFETSFCLRRNPIDTIDSIKYSVTTIFDVTIAATVYYLKKGVQLSFVELNISTDQEWPTDGLDQDGRQQSIEITFTTKAVGPDKIDIAKLGIFRHVAYMYENRGDCGMDCNGCADAAGVKPIYNEIAIPKI